MIMDRAPDHMARVYFGLSGSDANETNVKLAWHYQILRGKPEKTQDHQPLARLSRLRPRLGVADRACAAITRASTCRLPGFLHTETPALPAPPRLAT